MHGFSLEKKTAVEPDTCIRPISVTAKNAEKKACSSRSKSYRSVVWAVVPSSTIIDYYPRW